MNKLRCPYFFLFVLTFFSVQDFALPLTTIDKIISYGYPLEVYSFKTEDNALLGAARIPHGKQFSGTVGKPILLMGALLIASFPYVITNDSIAFRLADAGFDVWLPDYRAMGLSNIAIDPKTGKKRKLSQINWNYSVHELGVYDFPAAVDFVLNHTKYSKVDVLEVSLGCTIVMIGLSERPEYNAKIRNNMMLAPAVRTANSLGLRPFQTTAARFNIPIIIRYLKMFKYINISLDPINLCKTIIFRYQCMLTFIYLQGVYDPIDHKILADLVPSYPQPASSKYWIHFLQLWLSGRFQNFDYGPIENMKHYNSTFVPQYDVRKVTAPTIIIYSKADRLTAVADVQWLFDNMPNIKDSYFIKNVTISHQTFLFSKKSPVAVYPYIFKKLLEDD